MRRGSRAPTPTSRRRRFPEHDSARGGGSTRVTDEDRTRAPGVARSHPARAIPLFPSASRLRLAPRGSGCVAVSRVIAAPTARRDARVSRSDAKRAHSAFRATGACRDSAGRPPPEQGERVGPPQPAPVGSCSAKDDIASIDAHRDGSSRFEPECQAAGHGARDVRRGAASPSRLITKAGESHRTATTSVAPTNGSGR